MCAVPNTTVFCSSSMSCFPGILLRYFLSDSEMVSFAPVTAGIALVLTFHARCPSTVRCPYFKTVSATYFIIFLSPETAVSPNMHVPCSLAEFMSCTLLIP